MARPPTPCSFMKTTRFFEFLPKTWNLLDSEKILEIFNVIQKIGLGFRV
jgi:hypothetical protein